MAAFGPTMFLVDRVHIRFFGNGHLWFRPYGDSLFLTSASKKVSKKSARPERPAPRWGSAFLRSGIHPGALPSGRLRFDLHAMSSTASNGAARQSPDECLHSASRGGGQIKSSRGGLPAGLIFLTVHNSKCGSGLAREGDLTAGQFLAD
ncbi:hypothetical protein EMIT0P43_110112 [Pseudomonas jessenii]